MSHLFLEYNSQWQKCCEPRRSSLCIPSSLLKLSLTCVVSFWRHSRQAIRGNTSPKSWNLSSHDQIPCRKLSLCPRKPHSGIRWRNIRSSIRCNVFKQSKGGHIRMHHIILYTCILNEMERQTYSKSYLQLSPILMYRISFLKKHRSFFC